MEEIDSNPQKGSDGDDEPSEKPPELEAVDAVRDAHDDYLGLVPAAADGDIDAVEEHASELRAMLDEVESLLEVDS